ncbi:MAG: phosphoribosylaminoimidazolesuccinocarboxamide synthase [Oscillatoriales cyanobacterium]|nr:MAG: phosphoribosylaminoimidazolesuccinocarboxamide synthase [Oscillatoriales cyanobacterium]
MSADRKLYEGKAKILYSTEDSEILLTHFKDDATAFNAQKRGSIAGKGEINCAISAHLFRMLEAKGIPTHFIDTPAPNQMRVCRVGILPLEVVVRNIAAGSLCKQTGIALGTIINPPLVEFYYKNDDLGDPLLTRGRLQLMQLATPEQVKQLEFGIDQHQNLILADEISPDTCRLWDNAETDPDARVMDKDRFRRDLGSVESAYQQVLQRVLAQKV